MKPRIIVFILLAVLVVYIAYKSRPIAGPAGATDGY